MIEGKKPIALLLLQVFVGILLIFLISTPGFYFLIAQNAPGILLLEIAARLLRALLAIGLCWAVRKKKGWILDSQEAQRKKVLYIVLGCIAACTLLHMSGMASDIYYGISMRIGFYTDRLPTYFSVLWEQILGGDMCWSMLVGFVVLLFPAARRKDFHA